MKRAPEKLTNPDIDFTYSQHVKPYTTPEGEKEFASKRLEYERARREVEVISSRAVGMGDVKKSAEWNASVTRLVEGFELLTISGQHWSALKTELQKNNIPEDYFKECKKTSSLDNLATKLLRFAHSTFGTRESNVALEDVVDAYIKIVD